MKDIISIIGDLVLMLAYACARMFAIVLGMIGVSTQQVELMTTAILFYLLSNTFENIMNDRIEDEKEVKA